ncbi:hypothetical protein [Mesorhizobium amorphae]
MMILAAGQIVVPVTVEAKDNYVHFGGVIDDKNRCLQAGTSQLRNCRRGATRHLANRGLVKSTNTVAEEPVKYFDPSEIEPRYMPCDVIANLPGCNP